MDRFSKYLLYGALVYGVGFLVLGYFKTICPDETPTGCFYETIKTIPPFTWQLPAPGHYHLHTIVDGEVSEAHYQILEVAENGRLLYKWTGLDDGIYGHCDPVSKWISIGGECFYIGADYQRIDENSFTMTELSDYHPTVHYLARRYEAEDCDREREYFRNQTVEVTLPYSTPYSDASFTPTYRNLEIYTGRSRETGDFSIQYGDGYRLQVSLAEVLSNELEPPTTRPDTSLRIANLYADRNTPDEVLADVFAEMRKNDLRYYRRIERSHSSGPDFGLYASGVYRLD